MPPHSGTPAGMFAGHSSSAPLVRFARATPTLALLLSDQKPATFLIPVVNGARSFSRPCPAFEHATRSHHHRGGTQQYAAAAIENRDNQSHIYDPIVPVTDQQLNFQRALSTPADALRRIFLRGAGHTRAEKILSRVQSLKKIGAPTKRVEVTDFYTIEEHDKVDDAVGLIKTQLLACHGPQDILHILTVACQSTHPAMLKLIGRPDVQQIIVKRLCGVKVDAHHVHSSAIMLSAITVLQQRFSATDLAAHTTLMQLAAWRAACDGQFTALAKWLRLMQGGPVVPQEWLFRIIDGVRLGLEKQPSQQHWRRQMPGALSCLRELFTVDGMPCHIGTLLADDNTACFGVYLEALGACGGPQLILGEWKQYERSPEHRQKLPILARAFALAFFETGLPEQAWRVLCASFGVIENKDARLWTAIFRNLEHMPHDLMKGCPAWAKEAEVGISQPLTADLLYLEKQLGITWIINEHGDGFHECTRRFSKALEELGIDRPGSSRHANDITEADPTSNL